MVETAPPCSSHFSGTCLHPQVFPLSGSPRSGNSLQFPHPLWCLGGWGGSAGGGGWEGRTFFLYTLTSRHEQAALNSHPEWQLALQGWAKSGPSKPSSSPAVPGRGAGSCGHRHRLLHLLPGGQSSKIMDSFKNMVPQVDGCGLGCRLGA